MVGVPSPHSNTKAPDYSDADVEVENTMWILWLQRSDSNRHEHGYEPCEKPFLDSAIRGDSTNIVTCTSSNTHLFPLRGGTRTHVSCLDNSTALPIELPCWLQHAGVTPAGTCTLSRTACCIIAGAAHDPAIFLPERSGSPNVRCRVQAPHGKAGVFFRCFSMIPLYHFLM